MRCATATGDACGSHRKIIPFVMLRNEASNRHYAYRQGSPLCMPALHDRFAHLTRSFAIAQDDKGNKARSKF